MPSKATLAKIAPTNPFAICASQGLKQGTPEYERCVHSVTKQALARNRKGRRGKKR